MSTQHTPLKQGRLERVTVQEAIDAGFTVDTHVYPPFAYRGPRFAPTSTHRCFTELEAELMEALKAIAGSYPVTEEAEVLADIAREAIAKAKAPA